MQNNKGDNYYVDLDSIKHTSSETVRISKRVEFKDSSGYFLVSDIELDCEEKRIRVLKETYHDKNGEVKTTQKNEKWQYVNAEDIDELLLEFICSLKKTRN